MTVHPLQGEDNTEKDLIFPFFKMLHNTGLFLCTFFFLLIQGGNGKQNEIIIC